MFETNPNKDIIRRFFDKALVRRQFEQKGGPLVYFGLPSGRLYDVIEWKEYLGRVIAVERNPDEKRLIHETAFACNLLDKIQVLEGDIDDVLITGHDEWHEKPRPESFDVVNLDYYGGLIVKDFKGNSKRVSAVKSLLQRQAVAERDFRLFLTVNVRNRDRGELDNFLKTAENQLAAYGTDANETIEWYLSSGVGYKLKVYVPGLLSNIAVPQRFSLTSYDIVLYEGGPGTNLVHFALKFSFTKDLQGQAIDLLQLLASTVQTVKNGQIVPAKEYPPTVREPAHQQEDA